MSDFALSITPYVAGAIGSIVSYVVGARIRRNDTISQLQKTIDSMVSKNADLYEELAKVREENKDLLIGQQDLKLAIDELRRENERLRRSFKKNETL